MQRTGGYHFLVNDYSSYFLQRYKTSAAFSDAAEVLLNECGSLDFLGNFRSTVLLVSFAPGFVSLPCITPSSAALETLRPAQNILRKYGTSPVPEEVY